MERTAPVQLVPFWVNAQENGVLSMSVSARQPPHLRMEGAAENKHFLE
jgi:hypothetical protein